MIGIVCTMNPETGALYFSGWNKGDNPLWHLQKVRMDPDDKEMKFSREIIIGYIEGYKKLPKTIKEFKGYAGLALFHKECFETRNKLFPNLEPMYLKDVDEIKDETNSTQETFEVTTNPATGKIHLVAKEKIMEGRTVCGFKTWDEGTNQDLTHDEIVNNPNSCKCCLWTGGLI